MMGGMLRSLGVRSFRPVLLFLPGVRTNFLSGPVWLRGRGIFVPDLLALDGALLSCWSSADWDSVRVWVCFGILNEVGADGQSSERSSSHA